MRKSHIFYLNPLILYIWLNLSWTLWYFIFDWIFPEPFDPLPLIESFPKPLILYIWLNLSRTLRSFTFDWIFPEPFDPLHLIESFLNPLILYIWLNLPRTLGPFTFDWIFPEPFDPLHLIESFPNPLILFICLNPSRTLIMLSMVIKGIRHWFAKIKGWENQSLTKEYQIEIISFLVSPKAIQKSTYEAYMQFI